MIFQCQKEILMNTLNIVGKAVSQGINAYT